MVSTVVTVCTFQCLGGPGRDLNEYCAGRGTTVSWSLSAQGSLSYPPATSTYSLSRHLEVTHATPRPWCLAPRRRSVNAGDEGGGEEGDSEGTKDVM